MEKGKFEVVDIRGERVIGWRIHRDGLNVGWVTYQEDRVYFDEI